MVCITYDDTDCDADADLIAFLKKTASIVEGGDLFPAHPVGHPVPVQYHLGYESIGQPEQRFNGSQILRHSPEWSFHIQLYNVC